MLHDSAWFGAGGHGSSQLPQWLRSDEMSMQASPQHANPIGQLWVGEQPGTQLPLSHTSPASQLTCAQGSVTPPPPPPAPPTEVPPPELVVMLVSPLVTASFFALHDDAAAKASQGSTTAGPQRQECLKPRRDMNDEPLDHACGRRAVSAP